MKSASCWMERRRLGSERVVRWRVVRVREREREGKRRVEGSVGWVEEGGDMVVG